MIFNFSKKNFNTIPGGHSMSISVVHLENTGSRESQSGFINFLVPVKYPTLPQTEFMAVSKIFSEIILLIMTILVAPCCFICAIISGNFQIRTTKVFALIRMLKLAEA